MEVLCRSSKARLVREVRYVDDQRIPLPVATRIAQPLAGVWVKMRPAVQRDDACVVHHLVEDGHVSRSLDDLIVVVVPGRHHHAGQPSPRDAAREEAGVLRTCGRGASRRPRCRGCRPPRLRLRVQRRHPTVRRVHHEPRALVPLRGIQMFCPVNREITVTLVSRDAFRSCLRISRSPVLFLDDFRYPVVPRAAVCLRILRAVRTVWPLR